MSCSPRASPTSSGSPSARRRYARYWSISAPARMSIGSTTLRAARDGRGSVRAEDASVRAEDKAAGRHPGPGGDQDRAVAAHLIDRDAADLANGLGDEVHAVDVRLAQLAAVRIEGQDPVQLDGPAGDELPGLAARAETQLLQLQQNIRREVGVQNGGPHFLRADPRLPPQLTCHHPHLQQPQLIAVIASHRELAGAAALGGGADHDRALQ